MRIAIVILTLAGCLLVCTAALSQTYDDAEAFAVYSVLLEKPFGAVGGKQQQVIISGVTSDFAEDIGSFKCLVAPEGREAELEPVFASFRQANQAPLRLTGKLNVPFEYQFLSRDSLHALFLGDPQVDWLAFYRKYPKSGGYFKLSAVGFNSEKTLALVYAGNYCGELCGGGWFRLFAKKNGKWIQQPNFALCAWAR